MRAISYIVTSTTERIVNSDDSIDACQTRGTAKTLAVAKRKARAAAEDYLRHAIIEYYEGAELVYAEINDYGILGDWREYLY